MAIEITTYQLPDAGQPIEVYRDALRQIGDRAMDFSRSMGRISWIQGSILLRARERCKKRDDWKAFLASVGMKKETAYLLRRVATDIVPEKKDLEYSEMLAIVFPNSYGKHLREGADSETFGKQGKPTRKQTGEKEKTQTIDKVYARLATVKNTIQDIADRKLVDSKLPPEQAVLKYDHALGAIDVCREELGKLAKTLRSRKSALTTKPKASAAKTTAQTRKAAA